MSSPALCYLCGESLAEPISRDHVPPQQFYAASLRKKHNLSNVLTIPVHRGCNESYQLDEDYFVYTLAPFVPESYSGREIYSEVIRKYKSGKKVALAEKVLKEFDSRPSGLILPKNKVVKRFEGERVQRVVSKIVRGLYFHHHQTVLPPDLMMHVSITAPGEEPPEHFKLFTALPNNEDRGQYPGVFDYRFQMREDEVGRMHYWAMLLWDAIIITAIFHDPVCECEECKTDIKATG